MSSDYEKMMRQLQQEQDLKRSMLENERLERERRASQKPGERMAERLASGKGCAGMIVLFFGVVAAIAGAAWGIHHVLS